MTEEKTSLDIIQESVIVSPDNSPVNSDNENKRKVGRPKSDESKLIREQQFSGIRTIKTIFKTLTRKQKRQLVIDLISSI